MAWLFLCEVLLHMSSTSTIYLTEFSSAYSVQATSTGVTIIISFNLVLLLLQCTICSLVYSCYCRLVHEDRAQCFDFCIILAHGAVKKLKNQEYLYEKTSWKYLSPAIQPVCVKITLSSSKSIKTFCSHLSLWLQLSSEGGKQLSTLSSRDSQQTYGKLLSPSGAELNFEGNIFGKVQNCPL